jgi:hypothetical protein
MSLLEPTTPPERRFWSQRNIAVVCLVLCALLIALTRLRTYNEPFERDATSYAVIAREMLRGRSLYADLWDIKPPGIHLTYALSEILFGYGRRTFYILGTGTAVATLLVLFACGVAAGGGLRGGVLAALFWTFVCGAARLQANQPNTEAFTNFFSAGALALLLWPPPSRGRSAWFLLAGFCLFAASFYKPTFVAMGGLLALGHFIAPDAGAGNRRRAALDIALMAAVGIAGWALALLVLYFKGLWPAFYEQVVVFNRDYASGLMREEKSGVLGNLLRGLRPSALAPDFFRFGLLLAVPALAGLLINGKSHRRAWILLAALAVATHIQVAASGQFYPHYYQQWLPVLVVGAAWGCAALARTGSRRATRWAALVGPALVLILAARSALELRRSPEEWTLLKYGLHGEYFIQARDLSPEINALLAPGESFYQWGVEPGFYMHTKRSPASPVFHAYPSLFGGSRLEIQKRVIRDLESAQTELIVLLKEMTPWTREGAWLREKELPLLDWICDNYRPAPPDANRGHYLFYIRKGGALEARLAPNPSTKEQP